MPRPVLQHLQQRGHGSGRGEMPVAEVIEFYGAPHAEITESAILINIRREWRLGLTPEQLYERTRRYWRVNSEARNPSPQYAYAVALGIVRGVYGIMSWEMYRDMSHETLDSTRLDRRPGPVGQSRRGFLGRAADDKQG